MTTTLPSVDRTFHKPLAYRPRRNRRSPAIRQLVAEHSLTPADLVAPLFLLEGDKQEEEITSMPGVYRHSIDLTLRRVEAFLKRGVAAVNLFPVIDTAKKRADGNEAFNPEGLLPRTIQALKQEFPDLWVIADIALDPFTDHGHDGIVSANGEIENDPTLHALGLMALNCAHAGCDMVAPSDMMDGRVGYLREQFDRNGFDQVGILAYTAKYASAFYGPFRDALHSAPKFGDKKTYQLDPANVREALLEATLDESEGADALMVKPALPYLDVLAKLREETTLPLAAYHVSGEYAMIQAAAQNGWIDGDRVLYESLLSIKRAGANFILTYGIEPVLDFIEKTSR